MMLDIILGNAPVKWIEIIQKNCSPFSISLNHVTIGVMLRQLELENERAKICLETIVNCTDWKELLDKFLMFAITQEFYK